MVQNISGIKEIEIYKYVKQKGEFKYIKDFISIEKPLKIYINGFFQTMIMRTPDRKSDIALVYGYLFTEGIVDSKEDIVDIDFCKSDENRINVILSKIRQRELNRYSTIVKTSCGICGETDIDFKLDMLQKQLKKLSENNMIKNSIIKNNTIKNSDIMKKSKIVKNNIKVKKNILYEMKDKFEKQQNIFDITGSVHSAALFDNNFKLVSFAEDVGRHNALDKAIGFLVEKEVIGKNLKFINNRNYKNYKNKNYKNNSKYKNDSKNYKNNDNEKIEKSFILFLSSRVSFEMVIKAIRANVEIIVAFSSVTSYAYEIACRFDLTLIGFFRNKGFNVYSGYERII